MNPTGPRALELHCADITLTKPRREVYCSRWVSFLVGLMPIAAIFFFALLWS